MPLLKKQPFRRQQPPKDLRPQDEIFYCEATKEVFRDYEEFFQRTILCNSLVWSCSITGKAGLTYEEAVDAEKKARKRLGTLPKPLKHGLLWTTAQTRRGRIHDVIDDVFRFAYSRYFVNEVVEAVIGDMWCDSTILRVIPPTQEEIDKDAAEEKKAEEEEEAKRKKEGERALAEGKEPPKSPKKSKEQKKPFVPPDYLFKYQVQETDPDDPANNPVITVEADDIRREKGCYTREKNLLFLKNVIEMGKDMNYRLKREISERHRVSEIKFEDIFAGPPPVFEETKRLKGFSSSKESSSPKDKKSDKEKSKHKRSKSDGASKAKGQGTLDSWVKGGGDKKSGSSKSGSGSGKSGKVKKQSAAEIEAEMKRMKEQSKRFQDEMRRRTEDAKNKKVEEKARERERKREEKRLVTELMVEYKKKRDDLECDDLKELPKPTPVQCRIPNHLFGDFLTLLQFFDSFAEVLEVKDSFGNNGISFDILESALIDRDTVGGPLYEVLSFLLASLFDLQDEEDEEVRVKEIAATDVETLDKNILGKDKDVAQQIKSATLVAQWPMKTQGVAKLRELHMDEYSITEILRLHLEMAGAFRSDKLIMWLYQQRGGFRLADDPGVAFRMEEPQITECLATLTVFEMSAGDKLKIMTCLMQQILSYATVRDVIDERYQEMTEAKLEQREARIAENKRQREMYEKGVAERKKERMQKKEGDPKKDENKDGKEEKATAAEAPGAGSEAHLTERQRLAIQAQKDKEETAVQRKEEIARSKAFEKEQQLAGRVQELQHAACPSYLGRDRAYRRYWLLDTVPGLFVEHDDDFVGACFDSPTPCAAHEGPMDEDRALKMARVLMSSKGSKSPGDEKASSDKENDKEETKKKKSGGGKQQQQQLKQKVLSAKNGTLATSAAGPSTSNGPMVNGNESASPADVKTTLATIKLEPIASSALPWGACLADAENCAVHSAILPRTTWSYFSTIEEVDEVIERLNPRGIREAELADKLTFERDGIVRNLRKFSKMGERLCRKFGEEEKREKAEVKEEEAKEEPMDVDGGEQEDKKKPSVNSAAGLSAAMDLTLRDQILEMEEKIYLGSLGTLKVRDRMPWRSAIQYGNYDRQTDGLAWGGRNSTSTINTPFESRLQSVGASREGSPDRTQEGGKRDSTGSNPSAAAELRRVKDLASAILQIGQMVDAKFFKPPLGEAEKAKNKRLKEEEKRRKEREAANDEEGAPASHPGDAAGNAKGDQQAPILTPLQEWENSLMKNTSYAQLFVHLTTLESSISWSKSLLNTKCRICRRKTDPENMLLCDGCDRGHHMYCLKPKLKAVPKGDWFCSDCKPKERMRSPKKKARRAFSAEDDEDVDQDDDQEDANDEERTGNSRAESEEEEGENNDDENGEEEEDRDDDDRSERSGDDTDEDDLPLRKGKNSGRNNQLLSKKKSKKSNSNDDDGPSKAKKKLSMLFGRRRCAAEASEKIAAAFDGSSGHSSGAEEDDAANAAAVAAAAAEEATAVANRTTRSGRVSKPVKEHETVLEAENHSSNTNSSAKDSGARNKRRRAVDAEVFSMFNPTMLEDLLNAMMRHKDGWPFDRPITKTDAPDYHKVVKRPLDLGTIRSSINRMKYSCNNEVLEDIRVVFANCRLYNKEDAEEYQCGERLERYFNKEIKKLGLLADEEGDEEEMEVAHVAKPKKKKARRTF